MLKLQSEYIILGYIKCAIAVGDQLAYSEEGGVLVIEGSRLEELFALIVIPEDDEQARVEKLRELGGTSTHVGDYSQNINENSSTKQH